MASEKQIIIAQISDLHIKTKGALAYGKVDTADALARLIKTLNCLKPAPDLVVISGDLVDGGSEEEYLHLKEHLKNLTLPYAVTCGNHDYRVFARHAFPEQNFADGSALNHIVPVGPLDIILLDSSVLGQAHGLLEDTTLEWLEGKLSGCTDRPAFLFMHHPPFATGIWHMDQQHLRNAEAFAAILKRHSRVRLVASGHVHRAIFTSFAGVVASVCPAPNHAVALDLDQSIAPSFVIEPPAFHLHVWSRQKQQLVTHQISVGTFDGPYPFFSNDGKLL